MLSCVAAALRFQGHDRYVLTARAQLSKLHVSPKQSNSPVNIVPHAAYHRFTSGMGKGGSDIQALAKAAASAAWQRKAGKNSKGGLNEKGRKSYERENPGSDLKAPVTGKVKPGGKAAKRRKSFCARMKGNKGPMKKPNGEPTRKALSLRKWKC